MAIKPKPKVKAKPTKKRAKPVVKKTTKSNTIKKEALNRTQYNHLDITNQLKREPKQKAIRKPKK